MLRTLFPLLNPHSHFFKKIIYLDIQRKELCLKESKLVLIFKLIVVTLINITTKVHLGYQSRLSI